LAHDLGALISAYGMWLVAAIIALECVCIPLPGETILITAAVYAAASHAVSIWSIVAAGIVGAIVGNAIAFWLGRAYGYKLLIRYGIYLQLDEARIKIGQYLFLRYGSKVVFFARFVPLLRSVAGFIAGANRMPWPGFMIANVAGAIAWVGTVCAGAYFFGYELTRLAGPIATAFAVVLVVVILVAARLIVRYEAHLAAAAERALPDPIEPLQVERT
jgi:membrane protein DedA with SNARE-associated domain